MPAKSQAQRGLIFGKRNQYGSKAKTPDKWKWIWDEDWENKGKLPKKKNKNETVQNVVMKENYRAKTVSESIYGDPYVSDDTTPMYKKDGSLRQTSQVMDEDEEWTLKSGDEVIFRLRGMGPEFEDADEGDIVKYDGKTAIIDSPETASEIGDRDYEYYNIWFPGDKPGDGEMFHGVSGYHLDVINESMNEMRGLPKFKKLKPKDLIGLEFSKMEYNDKNGTLEIFPEENDQSGHYEISCASGAMLGVYHPIPYESDTIRAVKPATDIGDIAIFFKEHPWIVLEDETGGEGIEFTFIYA